MSDCHHTRAVLDGEAPAVDLSVHLTHCVDCQAYADELDGIDAALRGLTPPQLPADLAEQTLDIVHEAMDSDQYADHPTDDPLLALRLLTPPALPAGLAARTLAQVDAQRPVSSPRRWGWGVALATAAAALLLVVRPDPPTPDLGRMTEKGSGVHRPSLDLKVAVSRDGALERYRADTTYGPGDVLYFRVASDRAVTATLLRVDGERAAVVHQQQLSGDGAEDLRLDGGPLAWTIEPGEQSADFVILASTDPGQGPEDALPVLTRTDPATACALLTTSPAMTAPVGCEQVHVEVMP